MWILINIELLIFKMYLANNFTYNIKEMLESPKKIVYYMY